MLVYFIRRLFQAFLVLLIVMMITFTLPYFQTHGILGPAYSVLGTKSTPANVAIWGAQHGMNHPYIVRFWTFITQVFLHFNLGNSYKLNMSVWQAIQLYVPRTIWLAFFSLVLTMVIAIPLGMFQALHRNSVSDYVATGSSFILYAIPLFLLCMLSIEFLSFHTLHLPSSPPQGVAPWAIFTDPKGFLLPVGCLTLASVAGVSSFMRSPILEVMVQDYIRTAKAKGCSTRRIVLRHAFRNALGPVVVILGLYLPALIGGALIVESVFNYSGLGLETVNAAINLDLPIVLGITFFVAILTVLGNLFADIVLGLINPRIRLEGADR